jgi:hypothetical protein
MSTRELNQLPAAELKKLLERFGVGLADQPSRVGGLLRDTCGQYRLEIALLVSAAEEAVPADLLRESSGPSSGRIGTLATRLETRTGLSERNARWAVESWAHALGAPISSERAVSNPPEKDVVPETGEVSSTPSSAEVGVAAAVIGASSVSHPGDAEGESIGAGSPDDVLPPPPGDERSATIAGDSAGTAPPRRRAWLVFGIGAIVLVAASAALAISTRGAPEREPDNDGGVGPTQTDIVTGPSGATGPSGGSGPSGPSGDDATAHVAAPTNFHKLAVSPSQVTLIWERGRGGGKVDHFVVLRDGEVYEDSVEERRFTDNRVRPGRTYEYQVIAVGVDGSEAESRRLPVAVPQPPSPEPPPTSAPSPPPQDEGCPPGYLELPSGECVPPS